MQIEQAQAQSQSQLFTLRVWEEQVGDGRCEVRGQVKHILTGETSYFRQWPELLALLQEQLELKQINHSREEDK